MKKTDIPEPRPSREATLGADGLQDSQAAGTVPATAPDDARTPVYSDSTSAQGLTDEPRASREASLGGASSASSAAGGLAPEDDRLPQGAQPGDPDPERDWADDSR